jgi:hypothetical protein
VANTLSEKTKSGDLTGDTISTDEDMTKVSEWKYGIKLFGTFAKSLGAEARYRNDINRAYGKESDYYDGNIIYIDTFKPIGKQLESFKK